MGGYRLQIEELKDELLKWEPRVATAKFYKKSHKKSSKQSFV